MCIVAHIEGNKLATDPESAAMNFRSTVCYVPPTSGIVGVWISKRLFWKNRVHTLCNRAAKPVRLLKYLHGVVTVVALRAFYITFISPILEYASPVGMNLSLSEANRFESHANHDQFSSTNLFIQSEINLELWNGIGTYPPL
jgi:hypothetical protein